MKPEELARRACYELIHGTDKPWPNCPHERVLETGKPARAEFFEPRLGMHLEVAVSPIFNDEGEVAGSVHIVTDITERKKAEEALRESEEKYRKLVSTTTDAIMVFDAETRQVIEVNEACEKLYGYSREEFLRLRHADITAEPELSEDSIRKTIEGTLERIPVRYHRNKDGTVFPVEIGASTFVQKGRLVVCGVIRDISERKRWEEKLRHFQKAVDGATDAIGMSTPEGKHYYQNKAMKKLFGLSVKEMEGENGPPSMVYVDEKVGHEVFTTIMRGDSWTGEVEMLGRGGRKLSIFLRAYSIKDDSGKVIGLVGVHSDITELKRMEEQLRHAQKMEAVGTLAGGLAHDFNNILAGAMGYLNLMKKGLARGRPPVADLESIERLLWRGSDITQALLTFSRKSEYHPQALDVREVIEEVLKVVGQSVGKGVTIRPELSPDTSNIFADRGQVYQMLANLCINACEAMPDGGTLTVKTGNAVLDEELLKVHKHLEERLYVSIAVSDTGEGMDEETRNHIFEPFFTTKAEKSGTGLGLAMVIGVVEGQGGCIEVRSEPGKGSTFVVYFPATEKKVREVVPKLVGSFRGDETVLIVDDEKDFRKTTGSWLRELGYTVLEAENGEDAVRVLKEKGDEIDLVLLDMVMKGMSGATTYKEMLKAVPGLAVVICTGYTLDGSSRRLLREGARGFIQKPFDANLFALKIREVLDGC